MQFDSLPTYSVKELNEAIGSLLSRGFAPRFILTATISKVQLKRGHLWMTLTDGNSSIDGVVWSSQLSKINYKPNEGDGILVIGKLNFWEAQARLNINVIDIKPSISTVLRKFEVVRRLLDKDGLLDQTRKRPLPSFPASIAILTSVPSSALADMLRTAKERWPMTKLFIISVPVQGDYSNRIISTINNIALIYEKLGIEALIVARGGGSREDLILFDNEQISRVIANFPIPVITGIGHEDDLTVIDLVADHRSATPTAAIVDLLPSREIALSQCLQKEKILSDQFSSFIKYQRNTVSDRLRLLKLNSPNKFLEKSMNQLNQKQLLLNAYSPSKLLKRGFSIIRNLSGELVTSVQEINPNQILNIEFKDGSIDSIANKIYNK